VLEGESEAAPFWRSCSSRVLTPLAACRRLLAVGRSCRVVVLRSHARDSTCIKCRSPWSKPFALGLRAAAFALLQLLGLVPWRAWGLSPGEHGACPLASMGLVPWRAWGLSPGVHGACPLACMGLVPWRAWGLSPGEHGACPLACVAHVAKASVGLVPKASVVLVTLRAWRLSPSKK